MNRRYLNTQAALRRASFATWLARRAAIARRRADSCERKAVARIAAHRRAVLQTHSDEADGASRIVAIVGSAHRGYCPSLDYYDGR